MCPFTGSRINVIGAEVLQEGELEDSPSALGNKENISRERVDRDGLRFRDIPSA